MTCVFMFVYQNTVEPIAQVYITETCSDIALGVGTQIQWIVILAESLTVESLMQQTLKPEGVFIIFGIFSMLAVISEWVFVGETAHLSEKEKKSLYAPGKTYGRELREDEFEMDSLGPEMSIFSPSVNGSNRTSQASSSIRASQFSSRQIFSSDDDHEL